MSFADTIGLDGDVVAQSSPGESDAYTFDGDGRLTAVDDTTSPSGGSSCTVRQYGFDQESNRTSLTTSTASTSGCSTGSTASTVSGVFDAGDRVTNAGYTYDVLGRTLTVPGADAPGSSRFPGASGTLALGYFANDMAASETQGYWSVSYGLDPLQSRFASIAATNTSTSSTTSTVNDYTDNGDSPAWSSVGGSWTRDVTGPDGMLDATVSQAGTVTLDLVNLQGSEVATSADTSTATGISSGSYASYSEYGAPTDAAASNASYGWEGGSERSATSLGGLVLMGARLYNPSTGRFLSADPVYAGNANPYTYPTDPTSARVTTGRYAWWLYAIAWAIIGFLMAAIEAVACAEAVAIAVCIGATVFLKALLDGIWSMALAAIDHKSLPQIWRAFILGVITGGGQQLVKRLVMLIPAVKRAINSAKARFRF